MKRALMVAVLAAVGATLPATPANAAIKIERIEFNPSGADRGTNAHLNREYIVLKNTGPRAKSLAGWTIHDAGRSDAYTFDKLRLRPGDTVTLHSGRGDDGAIVCGDDDCPVFYERYWDLDRYVWHNGGDTATLRRTDGSVADRCRYSKADSNPKGCT